MNHRILLVREWDSQMSGSTCCGRLDDGITCELGADGGDYAHTRSEMERMGEVYRALRAELPRDAVDLTVVDPRNMVWLLPAVWRDARRRGFTRGRTLRELQRATAQPAVVVDGNAIVSGRAPATDEIVDRVFAELAAAASERRQREATAG
jgi:hypothetical protein